jgi:hypothetical protein
MQPKFREAFFASPLIPEPLLAISCTVPILGRQLLMWHATGKTLSTSKLDNRIECCTTLAAITKQEPREKLHPTFKKIGGSKKKCSVRISSG